MDYINWKESTKAPPRVEYILIAVYCFPGPPGVLAAWLAKASSSLTILQKKSLQKLGPLSFFLNARVSFKWDCREEGARKRVLILWSCKWRAGLPARVLLSGLGRGCQTGDVPQEPCSLSHSHWSSGDTRAGTWDLRDVLREAKEGPEASGHWGSVRSKPVPVRAESKEFTWRGGDRRWELSCPLSLCHAPSSR